MTNPWYLEHKPKYVMRITTILREKLFYSNNDLGLW